MNIFSQFGGCNSCLWILILLLVASCCNGQGIDRVLAGACTPMLVALIYTMCKNGTLCNLFCGGNDNRGVGGCGM